MADDLTPVDELPLERLLHSPAWSDDHLLALGRLVELSARLEFMARVLLIEVLGLDQRRGFALATGMRFSQIARHLRTLSKVDGASSWSVEVATWAASAEQVMDKRDALVHRSPIKVMTEDGWTQALWPSRRSQEVELDGDQVVPVLRLLIDAHRSANELSARRPGAHS